MLQAEFNLHEALALRDEGICQVAENNAEFLKIARNIARRQAMRYGETTSDDVRKHCRLDPLHPNAWGALFKTNEWQWTGKYRRSALVQGHGNMQRVWRLR